MKKLFVLLLHFPPSMFFDACYPSLFLRGWNHYYLDTIGHTPSLTPGVVNIEEWFERCCFPHRGQPSATVLCNLCVRMCVQYSSQVGCRMIQVGFKIEYMDDSLCCLYSVYFCIQSYCHYYTDCTVVTSTCIFKRSANHFSPLFKFFTTSFGGSKWFMINNVYVSSCFRLYYHFWRSLAYFVQRVREFP